MFGHRYHISSQIPGFQIIGICFCVEKLKVENPTIQYCTVPAKSSLLSTFFPAYFDEVIKVVCGKVEDVVGLAAEDLAGQSLQRLLQPGRQRQPYKERPPGLHPLCNQTDH